ncbi:MAG: hypothetical protein C0183_07260 [Roseiflexus castenholzii]|uniref:hypothetical protein n=1 Tax=Roseiflexus castenholzii TaxID=120962 RepID=UPI000CA6F7E4|nr:MAG: hypothetical protein C0183_07260 [Roseiflexus castenholzii]
MVIERIIRYYLSRSAKAAFVFRSLRLQASRENSGMEAYQRLQFDLLLGIAIERFVERITHRCGGYEAALTQLRADPQGEGVCLDTFVRTFLRDFLLDNPAGACFILQALARREIAAPQPGAIGTMIEHMAVRAFADLLAAKTEEALEMAGATMEEP